VLWALAPLLVYTVAYCLWVPGVLEYSAWKRGEEVSPSDVASGVVGYFLFPPVLLFILLFRAPLLNRTLFVLLTVAWLTYLAKLHTRYKLARSP
jgi:hypothetical protein